jgi:hypothetical protein
MATPPNRVSLISDIKPDGRSRRSGRAAGPEHVRHPLSLALGVVAVVGGLALGVMALPRLLAAIVVLQAQPITERYIAGERGLLATDIARAAERLEFALDLAPDASTALMLADLRLWQARRATDAALIVSHAQQSVEAAKVAARHAPAHPAAWTVLAEALDVLTQGDAAVIAPLARALQVAPYDPRRRDARVVLALRHWQALPPEAQRAAGPPIVATARTDINGLARLAKQTLGLGAVRIALADDPALAQRFDAVYIALPN